MSASAVESQLMRGNLKTLVGKFSRFQFTLAIEQDIENAVAQLTDKMLVTRHQRVEMLRSPEHEHLKLLIGNEFL